MDGGAILTCALSSTVAVTLVTSIKEIIMWKMNRKAKLEDKEEDKTSQCAQLNSSILAISQQLDNQSAKDQEILATISIIEDNVSKSIVSNRILFKDRIKHLALKYVQEGEVDYTDREALHEMWKLYHYELGGNGDLDSLMELLDSLPLKGVNKK